MKSTAHTFNEENIEYLRGYIGNQEVETFLRLEVTTENATPEEKRIHETVKMCLKQMEKDGDNRWWISKDRKVLGYYQFMNPILLVSFEKFHDAFEILLGRSVFVDEMALNYDKLKEEAEKAFKGHTEF